MDGSQKLPQRLLAPIAVRLERGQGIETLALVDVACNARLGDGGREPTIDSALAKRRTADRYAPGTIPWREVC